MAPTCKLLFFLVRVIILNRIRFEGSKAATFGGCHSKCTVAESWSHYGILAGKFAARAALYLACGSWLYSHC